MVLYISSDTIQSRKYKSSEITNGEICELQGTELVKYYGRYSLRPYGKYLVLFYVNGEEWIKPILLKNAKLVLGEQVEIHYVIENNEPEILDDIAYQRWKELKIAFLIAVPFCAVLIYMKSHGII